MKQPLVSIIISSYNYGRFLKEAIDSALNQTYQNKEIIVVDDGSTDNSPEIILEYGNKIIPIFKKNGGQASAFNAGFTLSKGEIIVFLDSDDVLLPFAVGKVVRKFTFPEVVKVHWRMWRISAEGKNTGQLEPNLSLADGNIFEQLVSNGPNHGAGLQPPTSGNAWSRRFLEIVFPMPEKEYKTCPDSYLFVLAPIYGKLVTEPEPLSLYRVHGNNYSLRAIDKYLEEVTNRFEVSVKILDHHLQLNGSKVDTSIWNRNSWFHRLNTSIKEILKVVPSHNSFVLVDDNHWNIGDSIAGRKRIPFMEKNGYYNGSPVDSNEAVCEVKRQSKNGAAAIIFAWTAFWFLDYYKSMHEYLKSNYTCILKNDRLIGFDLREKTAN
jgi:glycosyltransferase involved in cell wall biosynthesis